MDTFRGKVSEFVDSLKQRKILSLAAILMLVAAIPVTIFLSLQNQDIRQHAATNSGPPKGYLAPAACSGNWQIYGWVCDPDLFSSSRGVPVQIYYTENGVRTLATTIGPNTSGSVSNRVTYPGDNGQVAPNCGGTGAWWFNTPVPDNLRGKNITVDAVALDQTNEGFNAGGSVPLLRADTNAPGAWPLSCPAIPAATGQISASPATCTVGADGTCTVTINWATQNPRGAVQVKVRETGGLFAAAPSGSQAAPWITTGVLHLDLFDLANPSTPLATVTIQGTPAAAAVNATWSDWGACSAACGGGTQTRTCTAEGSNGGRTCAQGPADGAGTSRSCNTQACSSTNHAPQISAGTISAPTAYTNGTSQYAITLTASDEDGVNDIGNMLSLMNYTGANAGQHRGYIGWTSTDFGHWWGNAYKPNTTLLDCSGGGKAGIQATYGPEYINLLACVTSTSGTTRTVTFIVSFNPNFTTPTANNTVSGFVSDAAFSYDGWKSFQTFSIAPDNNPQVTATTINSPIVATNASAGYAVTMTASDADGVNDIGNMLGLINIVGANAGQYRGYFGWSSTDFARWWGNAYKSTPINCTGGGIAAMYGGTAANGYGKEYINLASCSTVTSGNTRTTTFIFTFNTNFTTPVSNNTIGAFVSDNAFGYDGWKPFGTFSVAPDTNPQITAGTISPGTVTPNGSSQYTITLTGSDADGVNDIGNMLGLINIVGTNAGQYRGYFGWSSTDFAHWWNNEFKVGMIDCTGGGKGGMYGGAGGNGFGKEYMNLTSCSTQVSGNTRSVAFTVTFLPNFAAPLTDNSVGAFISDSKFAYDGWKPFQTFSISPAGTVFAFDLTLNGLVGNSSSNHPQRTVLVQLFNSANQQVGDTISTQLSFGSGGKLSGSFGTGTQLPAGDYTMVVQTPQYLKKRLPGIISIPASQNTAITVPAATLITGDINGDNKIDILDYAALRDCYGNKMTAASCTTKDLADLNDDTVIDGIDYNIFLRSLATLQGD